MSCERLLCRGNEILSRGNEINIFSHVPLVLAERFIYLSIYLSFFLYSGDHV